jgi:hypothetical protein
MWNGSTKLSKTQCYQIWKIIQQFTHTAWHERIIFNGCSTGLRMQLKWAVTVIHLKGNVSSPQHKTNSLYKMDIITYTNMTDFTRSEMRVASQNDCKLTAYKFCNCKLLFSAEYLTNKILTQTQVKIVMEVTKSLFHSINSQRDGHTCTSFSVAYIHITNCNLYFFRCIHTLVHGFIIMLWLPYLRNCVWFQKPTHTHWNPQALNCWKCLP